MKLKNIFYLVLTIVLYTNIGKAQINVISFKVLDQYLQDGKIKINSVTPTTEIKIEVGFRAFLGGNGYAMPASNQTRLATGNPSNGQIIYLSPQQETTNTEFYQQYNAFLFKVYTISIDKSKLVGGTIALFTKPNGLPEGAFTGKYYNYVLETPPPTGPANDNYTGAISLSTTAIAGTTVNATQSSQAQNPCGNGNDIDDDVWYKFVATSTSHVISLTDVNFHNTQWYQTPLAGIAVYSSNLGYLGCDNTNGKFTATSLTIGQTYYVRIWSANVNNNVRMTYKIAVSIAGINAITNIVRSGYQFTAEFSHDPAIPLSDITFEWGLFPPASNEADSGVFSILPGSSPNQVYVEGTDGDTATRIAVRMKRISTNEYISEWYTMSGLIWWG